MIYLRKVVGSSMEPTLRDGQIVIVSMTRNYKKNDVVMAYMSRKEVIKRITKIENGKVFLEGDNKESSTDSRKHGWLVDAHIMGRVIWPMLRKPKN